MRLGPNKREMERIRKVRAEAFLARWREGKREEERENGERTEHTRERG